MNKYGFIGLGDQGAPIAERMIQGGLPVALWARRPETLEPFADTSADVLTNIEAFAKAVGYVGICVVDDDGTKEVCERLIPRLAAGSYVVIHSTVSPELCKQLDRRAKARGIILVDAPVSGGSPAARRGALTVMLGGPKAAVDALEPVLQTFASFIVHLGEVGAGQKAKLLNNAALAANIGIAHHCLRAADALDLDQQAFCRLINQSSGRSFGFEVRSKLNELVQFQHGADLLIKDLKLLRQALGEHPDFYKISEVSKAFLDSASPISGSVFHD